MLYQIIHDAGMSARPEFYSGRGATSSDLNSRILEKLYGGIKANYGDRPAKSFVTMVADMPKLSATDFLLALFRLERCGWNWSPSNRPNSKGIHLDGYGSALEMSAFGTIISVLGGMNERDETGYIRGEFLRNHKNEVPPPPPLTFQRWYADHLRRYKANRLPRKEKKRLKQEFNDRQYYDYGERRGSYEYDKYGFGYR